MAQSDDHGTEKESSEKMMTKNMITVCMVEVTPAAGLFSSVRDTLLYLSYLCV